MKVGRDQLSKVVLAVGVVVVVIVAAVMFMGKGRDAQAKIDSTRTELNQLVVELTKYNDDCEIYPSTTQGFAALNTQATGQANCKNWRGPYSKKTLFIDGWGHPLKYESDGTSYTLLSYGADGKEGGEGYDKDITFEAY